MTLALHGAWALLVARILLVAIFPFSAIDKLLHWDAALQQCRSSFIPGAPALLVHPFWRRGDFWVAGESVDRDHFWDFTKNFGLAGGLLLVALGGGFAPVP